MIYSICSNLHFIKIHLSILACLTFCGVGSCQYIEPDTFAIYCNSEVTIPPFWKNYRTEYKSNTIRVWKNHENGNIATEVFRLTDSTYLYKAYGKNKIRDSYCGAPNWTSAIIAEGLLTFGKNSQDTSILFDPISFNETYITGRFLIPTGEWKIYDSYTGKLYQIGNYNSRGRHGEWLQYNNEGLAEEKLFYKNGKLKKTKKIEEPSQYKRIEFR